VHRHYPHCWFSGLHQGKLVCRVIRLILPVSSSLTQEKSRDRETDNPPSDIGLVLAAYTIWKLLKGTKIVALADIPLVEALERAAQDQEEVKKVPKWRKFAGFLWD
jgi:hypothetical protein